VSPISSAGSTDESVNVIGKPIRKLLLSPQQPPPVNPGRTTSSVDSPVGAVDFTGIDLFGNINLTLCGGDFLELTLDYDFAAAPSAVLISGLASGSVFPVGTTTNVFEVTDGAGNTATCSFDVTVTDDEDPVIVCVGSPASVTDTASVSPGLPIISNAGPVISVLTVADDFDITDLDVNLDIAHTWVGDLVVTVESPAGTMVTIVDQMGVPASTFGCDEDDLLVTLDDEATDPIEDECSGSPITGSFIPNNSLDVFDGESTLGDWILTVTDDVGGDDGNLNAWGISYTHDVAAAPLIVELDANGMVTVDPNDLLMSVTDNCGSWTVTVGNALPINECGTGNPQPIDPPVDVTSPATITETGVIGTDYAVDTVELDITHTFDGDLEIRLQSPMGTILDLSIGNGGSGQDYTNTIFQDGGADITAASAPFTGVFEPEGGTFAAAFDGEDITGDWTLVIFDNFGGVDGGTLNSYCINFVPLFSLDFTCDDLGDIQIEVTVTDDSGNSAMCTATITVVDVTPPVLICADVTLELGPDGTLEIDPLDLLATLPDTYEVITISSDNQSGTEGFTDFTVPITDPDNVSFDWDYSTIDSPLFDSFGYLLNGAYTELTNPAGANNQSGNSGVIAVAPGDVFGFRSYSADNVIGAATTVISNFVPGFTGQFDPANWTLTLVNSDGDAFFVLIPGGPLSFDACGITIYAVDVTEVDCDDIGTPIVITVFVSDASGNIASCQSTVTVVDLLGPELTCPPDQTVDPGPGNLFWVLEDYWALGLATATDNCTDPVTITSQDPVPGTFLPDGVHTITITAEDEYGNVSTCTFELTVDSILGLDDNELNIGSIVMYPNPAKYVVNLSNPQGLVLDQAAIYDLNGRLIQTIDLKDMGTEISINVSHLASATYMVLISGEYGHITKQLIKE